MGFTIQYQQLIKLNFWQYEQLLRGAETLTLPPDADDGMGNLVNSEAVVDRIIRYDLRNILKVTLTPASQEELKKRGLIFKSITTGAIVASKDGYTESNTGYRLSFAVTLVDPNWQSYTETGVNDIQTQIFHLSNFNRTPAARLLLTHNGNEALRADHYVPRQGRVVRLPQSVPGTATTIEVFDALSTSVTPVLTITLPAITGQQTYELDCRSFREGLYRFEGPNITNTTMYLGLEDQPALVGVVDLFTAGWEGTTYDIRLAKP